MSIQDVGAIGEVAGAFLVGITLIYLAVQLRQNTNSVEMSALSGWLSARIAINEAMSKIDGETLLSGMQDSRSLTPSNFHEFGLMFQTYAMQGQVTHLLFKRGLVPKALWEIEMGTTKGLLSSSGVCQWWEVAGRGQVTPEFAALLDSTQPGPMCGGTPADGFAPLATAVERFAPGRPGGD